MNPTTQARGWHGHRRDQIEFSARTLLWCAVGALALALALAWRSEHALPTEPLPRGAAAGDTLLWWAGPPAEWPVCRHRR